MLDAKPNDAVTTAQVADLLRQAELTDQALELYRKASPSHPPTRNITNTSANTFITSSGPMRPEPPGPRSPTAQSERQDTRKALGSPLRFWIYPGSLPPLIEAVGLEPDSFDLSLKLAGLDHRLEKFDDAESQLALAGKLAEKDEEKDAVLEARVKNDQAAGRLTQRPKPCERAGRQRRVHRRGLVQSWPVTSRPTTSCLRLFEPPKRPPWSTPARSRPGRSWPGSVNPPAAWATPPLRSALAEIDRRNRTEHLPASPGSKPVWGGSSPP